MHTRPYESPMWAPGSHAPLSARPGKQSSCTPTATHHAGGQGKGGLDHDSSLATRSAKSLAVKMERHRAKPVQLTPDIPARSATEAWLSFIGPREMIATPRLDSPVPVFIGIDRRIDNEGHERLAAELDWTLARPIGCAMLCRRYNDHDTCEVFVDVLG